MKTSTKQEYIKLIRTKINMSMHCLDGKDAVRAAELMEEAVEAFNGLKEAIRVAKMDETKTQVNWGKIRLVA